MKLFVILFTLLILAHQILGASYECPEGAQEVGNFGIEVCSDPNPDGSCPSGAKGLSMTVNGNGNVPKFTWGLLQSSSRYNVMFQQLFEVDAAGKKVGGSTQSLPSWDWTFCQPYSFANESYAEIHFYFFGTRDGQGFAVTGSVVNSSDTVSFKWNLNIDDYNLVGLNNLVLFSKYQTDNGNSNIHINNKGELINGGSFIETALNATFDDTINVDVYTDSIGSSNNGYYITFDLISASISPSDPFHLVLDPEFGVNSAMAFFPSLFLVCLIFVLQSVF